MSDRPSFQQIYIEFAFSLARRSTCKRLNVGSVITTADFSQVLSVGYNGTGKGMIHDCNGEAGTCGCLHSEINALIKCGRQHPDKVLFVTDSPCHMCAKAIVNSGFSKVYYRRKYRITDGLNALHSVGIAVEQI